MKGRRGSRALFVMRLKDAVVTSHSAVVGGRWDGGHGPALVSV